MADLDLAPGRLTTLPHGPAGTSGPLSLDAPGRWGLQQASGPRLCSPGGLRTRPARVFLTVPCAFLSPAAARGLAGPLLQRPLPGGQSPAYLPRRCRGRPPENSGGAGGGAASPPRPPGSINCFKAPGDPPSQSPAHPTASAPASRHDPHGGVEASGCSPSEPHAPRPHHAHVSPPPAHAMVAGGSRRFLLQEPLGVVLSVSLGDAQLPGERAQRPRRERLLSAASSPAEGPGPHAPLGTGWDPHPRGDLGKASSPPPAASTPAYSCSRSVQLKPAPPRPPILDTVSPHPVTRRGGLTPGRGPGPLRLG